MESCEIVGLTLSLIAMVIIAGLFFVREKCMDDEYYEIEDKWIAETRKGDPDADKAFNEELAAFFRKYK